MQDSAVSSDTLLDYTDGHGAILAGSSRFLEYGSHTNDEYTPSGEYPIFGK